MTIIQVAATMLTHGAWLFAAVAVSLLIERVSRR